MGIVHPAGNALATSFISGGCCQATPRRSFSDSISKSRWLSTGQTGTHDPHIIHSCVKRATSGATSSEIVALFSCAIVTSDDTGTGQASIQRSHPIHISISNLTCSPLILCTVRLCSSPTTTDAVGAGDQTPTRGIPTYVSVPDGDRGGV